MARNDGIDRTSARNQCLTEKDIGKIEGHNERENQSYTNPDIDPSRSHLNVHFKTPTGSYAEMFAQMEADGQISTRGLKPDAYHYGEMVFDVNTAYFHNNGGYEYAKQFFAEAYQAAVKIVGGEQYILSAVMHADERNPRMSDALGYAVFHYHLHVVYLPVVEKQIKWTKRCKDPKMVGTVKQTIMQVSASKKWMSDPVLDEQGKPMYNAQGKVILNKSYSILQDQFYDHMAAAGYSNVQRGEKGSTEQHLTVLQYKTMKEEERLAQAEAQREQAEADQAAAQAAAADAQRAAELAQHEAAHAQAEAERINQEIQQADAHREQAMKEVAQAQEAAARARAEAAEAAELAQEMEQKADKAKNWLDKLLTAKKDVVDKVAAIGNIDEMLPKPGLLMSKNDYRDKVALPALRTVFNWCREAVLKLRKEREEHQATRKALMQANRKVERLEGTSSEYRDRASKFDRLVEILGIDRINQMFAEHDEQKRSHRLEHRRNDGAR